MNGARDGEPKWGKKILRIPYCNVLEALAPIASMRPSQVLTALTIPTGSCVLSVHENHRCRSFDYVLQHESFEATLPGIELPVIEATWRNATKRPRKGKVQL
jgi:hypothetical protein